MSATLVYREPYRLSAGLLALTVHVLFFLLLYVGVRWQSQPQDVLMVEMWDSLPAEEVVSEPVTSESEARLEKRPESSKRAEPSKPDIALRERLAKKQKEMKEQAKAKARAKEKERRELEAYTKRRQEADRVRQAERDRIRAEVEAASAGKIGDYQDKIRAKIRRNIKGDWSALAETAQVEFRVTLLPDGSVLDAVLKKGSGNAAYDNAVERAIYSAQPLPLPREVELQKMFRDLKLTIKPE